MKRFLLVLLLIGCDPNYEKKQANDERAARNWMATLRLQGEVSCLRSGWHLADCTAVLTDGRVIAVECSEDSCRIRPEPRR